MKYKYVFEAPDDFEPGGAVPIVRSVLLIMAMILIYFAHFNVTMRNARLKK